ncbi:MAG: type II toxin-antitoxin system VapC family toxin [Gaiellales bacterium]
MGLTLIDSSVVIGWIYADDTLHDACVEAVDSEVAARRPLAISTIAWAEVLTGANGNRKARLAAEEFLIDAKVRMFDVDRATAERAADLRRLHRSGARARLPVADAIILATGAVRADVERVLTADARWRDVSVAGAEVHLVSP